MALCVSSKFDSVQMTRTLQVDHVQFEIFSDLDFHGDAGTLVAEVSGYDDAILRCSVNGVFRNGKEVEQVAEREIPRLAEEAGATYDLCGDKYVFGTRKPGGDSSKDTVHFWYLGLEGHIAVVPCSWIIAVPTILGRSMSWNVLICLCRHLQGVVMSILPLRYRDEACESRT